MTDKPQPNSQPDKVETSAQSDSKPQPAEQGIPKPDAGADAPKSAAAADKPVGDTASDTASASPAEAGATAAASPPASPAAAPEEKSSAPASPPAVNEKPEEKSSVPADAKPSEKSTTVPLPDPSKVVSASHTDPTEPSKSPVAVPMPDADKFDTQPPEPKSGMPTPNTIVCPACQHHNRPGTLICENCGTNLVTGGAAVAGTRDLKREQEAVKEGEKLLDTEEVNAVASAGSSTFTEDMVLRIEVEGGSTPMLVYPKQEIIVGRRDPTSGGMPDVDLTAYAGYRMGVSRRHSAIRLQEKRLHVSDLGSSNGTFLNGTRLTAHRPYELRDGDEIRLGQMVMKVYFQSNKDRT